MAERKQTNRWRCLTVGCNPLLIGEEKAQEHVNDHIEDDTPHRVAKWPIRSASGEDKARKRNKSGYYDKWNTGDKSPEARGFINTGNGKMKSIQDDYDY